MKGSICKYNSNFKELVKAIDHEPAGTAFILDEYDKLCGIVTDGDFRRLLLQGKTMESQLSKSDFGDYVVAKQGESMEELLKKTSKKIRIIPIIDEKGFLITGSKSRAQNFKWMAVAAGVLSGKPGLTGAGLLVKDENEIFISWKDADKVYIDHDGNRVIIEASFWKQVAMHFPQEMESRIEDVIHQYKNA